MKRFQICLIYLLAILFITFNSSCKHEKGIKPTIPNGPDTLGKVFTNISDPRIAELRNDSNKITFFGAKDANANPIALSGYRVQSLTDTTKNDYVSFDDKGRYSTISFRTGDFIRFGYTSRDSIIVSFLSSAGELSIYKLPRVMAGNTANLKRIQSLANTAASNNSVIRVKIVAKNSQGVERNIDNSEVIVNISDGNAQYLQAEATPVGNGVYTIPVPTNVISNNAEIIENVVSYLQQALSIACYDCDSGCISIAETLEPFCAGIPDTRGKLICGTLSGVIFACNYKGDKLVEFLDDKLKEIESKYYVPDYAAVTAISNDIDFGVKTSNSIGLYQIKSNTNGDYDLEIVYPDNSIIGTWNVQYTWQGQVTGFATITFDLDNTFLDSQGTYGVYVQNADQLTFTFDNTTQYRGSGNASSISGTMLDFNGHPGIWSMYR